VDALQTRVSEVEGGQRRAAEKADKAAEEKDVLLASRLAEVHTQVQVHKRQLKALLEGDDNGGGGGGNVMKGLRRGGCTLTPPVP
jgi:polyphosphate kinase 2 (PPK2 family)